MIKEKYILAAGSFHNARELVTIFLSEGWQARSITNKLDAIRYTADIKEVPEYLFIDSLKDWVVQLAQELHSRGTQIRLYGCLMESPEELSARLGVQYYSTMGLPSKAAGVLLGKEFRDSDMDTPLFLPGDNRVDNLGLNRQIMEKDESD